MVFKPKDNCVVDYMLRYFNNPLIKFAMKKNAFKNPKVFMIFLHGSIYGRNCYNNDQEL